MSTKHSSKSTQRFETTTVSCTSKKIAVATDLVGSDTSMIKSHKSGLSPALFKSARGKTWVYPKSNFDTSATLDEIFDALDAKESKDKFISSVKKKKNNNYKKKKENIIRKQEVFTKYKNTATNKHFGSFRDSTPRSYIGVEFSEQMFSGFVPSMPKLDIADDTKDMLNRVTEETAAFNKAFEALNKNIENSTNVLDECAKDVKTEVEKSRNIFSDAIERVLEVLKGLPEIAEKMTNVTVKHIFDVGSMIPNFSNFLPSLESLDRDPLKMFLVNYVVILLILCFCKLVLKVSDTQYKIIVMLVTVIDIFVITPELRPLLKEACNLTADFVMNSVENVKSIFVEQSRSKDILNGVGVILMSIILRNHSFDKRSMTEKVASICSEFRKKNTDIKTVVEFLCEFLQSFLNAIGDLMGIKFLEEFGVTFPRAVAIAERLRIVSNDLSFQRIQYDAALAIEMRDLIFELQNLSEHMKLEADKVQRMECFRLLKIAQTIERSCGTAGTVTAGSRVEPTTVVIIGGPGTGKSTLVEYIIQDILPRILVGPRRLNYLASPKEETYPMSATNGEFMESYRGQFLVTVDDILQKVDTPTAPNPNVAKFIEMHNTTEYKPPKAAVDAKDSINFTSEIIFCTDNHEAVKGVVSSITNGEAFSRRFDLPYILVVKPQFCVEDLDYESRDRIPIMKRRRRESPVVTFSMDTVHEYQFQKVNWYTGARIGDPIEYEEFRDKVVALHKLKQGCGQRMQGVLRQVRERAIIEADVLAANGVPAPAMIEQVKSKTVDPWILFGLSRDCTAVEAKHKLASLTKRAWTTGDDANVLQVTEAFLVITVPKLREEWLLYEQLIAYDGPLDATMASAWADSIAKTIRDLDENPLKVKSWKEVVDVLVGYSHKASYYNTFGDDDIRESFCAKFNIPLDLYRAFIAARTRNVKNTLYSDLYEAYEDWLRGHAKETLDSTKSLLNKISSNIVNFCFNKTFIISASALIGFSLIGYTWFCKNNGFDVQSVTYMDSKRDFLIERGRHVPKVIGKSKLEQQCYERFAEVLEQSYTCGQGALDLMRVVVDACVSFYVDGDRTRSGTFLFTRGKMAIGCSHYMGMLTRGGVKTITLERSSKVDLSCVINVEDIRNYSLEGSSNEDLGFYNFPTLSFEMPNIEKHFIPKDDKRTDILSQKTHHGFLVFTVPHANEYIPLPAEATACATTYGVGSWTAVEAATYMLPTTVGDCGLGWILTDSRTNRPGVAGIHAAGGKGMGLMIRVSQEDIMTANKFMELDTQSYMRPVASAEWIPEQTPILKTLPKVNQSSVSGLKPSVLKGLWTDDSKAPVPLRPHTVDGIKVNPFLNSRAPYNKFSAKINSDMINHVAGVYSRHLRKLSSVNHPWEPRLFSFVEAAEGTGNKFYKSLPRSTSAGYYWSSLGPSGSKGKTAFFGSGQEFDFSGDLCKHLEEKVRRMEERASRGEDLEAYYLEFLKDEVRKVGKKARLVAGSPLDLTMLERMYFGDFQRFYQETRIHNWSALGINPYSNEWGILARHLGAPGNRLIDGDYETFDASAAEEVVEGFVTPVVESHYARASDYDPLDGEIRANLNKDFVNSKHVCPAGDVAYLCQYDNSVPSGSVKTAVFDTLINICYSMVARTKLYLKHTGKSESKENIFNIPDEFYFKDTFIANGDDNVLSVCDEHAVFINQITYGQAMSEMGLKYTDAAKKGVLVEAHRSIDVITFLKRSFRHIPDYGKRFFAPLDMDSILRMADYINKKEGELSIESTLDIMSMELSPHGFEVYNEKCSIIVPHLLSKGVHFNLFPINLDWVTVYGSWLRSLTRFMGREPDLE